MVNFHFAAKNARRISHIQIMEYGCAAYFAFFFFTKRQTHATTKIAVAASVPAMPAVDRRLR